MGGKISITYPGGEILKEVPFPQMDELMESEKVFFGMTASMSLYKSVVIKNFNFYEGKNFN